MTYQVALGLATIPFYALDSSNYLDFDWSSVDWYTITNATFIWDNYLIQNANFKLANDIQLLVSQPENLNIILAYYSDPAVQDAILNMSNAEFPAFRQQVLYRAVQLLDSVKNDAGLMQAAQSMVTVYSNIATQVHGHVHDPSYFFF